MKINTALILCAGLGKRLNPLTLSTPKPLLKLKDVTMLENCIEINIKLGIERILINTFHLGHQISEFVKIKKFPIDIQIIEDGNKILDTGGGIFNMIKHSQDNHFIVFNPDTLWHKNYIEEIHTMQKFYFSKKLNNILLSSHRKLSFDQDLKGDFNLTNNLLKKNTNNDFIYIGCQILDRVLFKNYEERIFSISEIWDKLLEKNELNGFESNSEFYHLTNLNIFNKLKDF